VSNVQPAAVSIADRWRGRFAGQLLNPVDEGYEQRRRIWNGMIDRRPALIARCATPADVQAAVKLARAEGLPLSVRGGGHNVAGLAVCEQGLMVDLSAMRGVQVDPVKREAVAAPGVLWGEFDAATQAHGLATTGGQVSHTGIAGLTLGGGLGYLMGKHGAACDNLLSVDLVTADGELLTASAEQNADLFWAVRGAGANFGIVTSFRYQVHPLSEVLAGMLLYPLERAAEVVAFHKEFLAGGTPDELDTTVGFLRSPEGMPLVGIIAVYAGAIADGERVLEPLRKFGPPIADLIAPMPYTAAQSMVDNAAPIGDRYYWKSNFVSGLEPGLAAVLRDASAAAPSPMSMILIFEIKGQIQRVPKDAMAFDHRDENFEMSIIARWKDPQQDVANMQWARDTWTAAQPYARATVYANHLAADETPERVRAGYGSGKYDKLVALKSRYDPDNLFRSNHNIAPAGRS
jgi:FAD/FMN-containing dehydrogenase